MNDVYVIVITPSDKHVYELGDIASHLDLAEKLQEIRTTLGVPQETYNTGWDLAVTYGEPHPTLMATAIIHRLQ